MAAAGFLALPSIDVFPPEWVRERAAGRLAPALRAVTCPVLAAELSESGRLGVLAGLADVMGAELLRGVRHGAWSGEGASRAAAVLAALEPVLEQLRAEAAQPQADPALLRDALAAYARAEQPHPTPTTGALL